MSDRILTIALAAGIGWWALWKLGWIGRGMMYAEPEATAPASIQRMIAEGYLTSDKKRRADAPPPVFSTQPVPVMPKENYLL